MRPQHPRISHNEFHAAIKTHMSHINECEVHVMPKKIRHIPLIVSDRAGQFIFNNIILNVARQYIIV